MDLRLCQNTACSLFFQRNMGGLTTYDTWWSNPATGFPTGIGGAGTNDYYTAPSVATPTLDRFLNVSGNGTWTLQISSTLGTPMTVNSWSLKFTYGVCGDGEADAGEECDDGNTASGDGCSSTCKVEPGSGCTTHRTCAACANTFSSITATPAWAQPGYTGAMTLAVTAASWLGPSPSFTFTLAGATFDPTGAVTVSGGLLGTVGPWTIVSAVGPVITFSPASSNPNCTWGGCPPTLPKLCAGTATFSVTKVTNKDLPGTYSLTAAMTGTAPYVLASYTTSHVVAYPDFSSCIGLPTNGGQFTLTGTNFPPPGVGVLPISPAMGDVAQINGTNCTSVTQSSTTYIYCANPNTGVDGSFTLNFQLGMGTPYNFTITKPAGFCKYAPPTLATATPASGSMDGGYRITITGLNFGFVSQHLTGVSFQGADCTVAGGSFLSYSSVLCLVPPGSGTGITLSVTAGTQVGSAGALFNYLIPQITAVSPATGIETVQVTNTTLTIFGYEFGQNVSTVTASVGAVPCPGALWVTNTSITCNIPSGSGASVAVYVTVFGRQSGTPRYIAYSPPLITSVDPPTALTVRTATLNLTLTGTNFACLPPAVVTVVPLGASLTCLSGTLAVLAVPTTVSLATGNVTVSFTRGSQTASGVVSVSPPTVNSGFFITSVSPGAMPVAARAPVTICGDSVMAAGAGDVLKVTLNAAGLLCAAPYVFNGTCITCTPAVAGAAFNATGVAVTSASLGTTKTVSPNATAPCTFSMYAATITSISPVALPVALGGLVTLFGFNFLPTAQYNDTVTAGSLRVGPTVTLALAGCAASSSGTQLVCTAPPVNLTATGNVTYGLPSLAYTLSGTVTGPVALSYGTPPTISAVVPASGPVSGGTRITVYGSGWQASPAPTDCIGVLPETLMPGVTLQSARVLCVGVSLGPSLSCTNATLVPNVSAVTCVTPQSPAAGPVGASLLAAGLTSDPPGVTFTYIAAASNGTAGANTTGSASLTPSSGSAAGGYAVTISGAALAASATDLAQVRFGTVACLSFQFVSTSQVVCTSAPASPNLADVTAPVSLTTISRGGAATVASFVYTKPQPVLLGAFPRDLHMAGGDPITLVGVYFSMLGAAAVAAAPLSVAVGLAGCAQPRVLTDSAITCATPPQSAAGTVTPGVAVQVLPLLQGSMAASTARLTYRPPGYLFCNPPCGYNGNCVSGVCVCDKGFASPPVCSAVVLSASRGAVYAAREDGPPALVVASLTVAPSAPVTVFANASLDADLAALLAAAAVRVEPASVTFTPASWASPQTFSFTNLRSTAGVREPARAFRAVLQSKSAAVDLDALVTDPVALVHQDSDPAVQSVTPATAPLLGGKAVVLAGVRIDQFTEVWVGGVKATVTQMTTRSGATVVPGAGLLVDVSALRRASWRRSALGAAPKRFAAMGRVYDSAVMEEVVSVTFKSTAQPKSGVYRDVALVSAYSGAAVNVTDALFITDDCPEPGQFGRGADCRPCPAGGFCPGGYRVRPLPGYWNPGEDSGYVVPCDPPEACLGATSAAPAACAPGYEGERCGACVRGNYRSAGACEVCPKAAFRIVFIAADVGLWTLFAVAATFLKNREALAYLVMALKALQSVAGVGASASGNMPRWTVVVYETLHIFSGDVTFIKPECGSLKPGLKFFISLVYTVALMVPMFLVVLVTFVLSKVRPSIDHEGRAVYCRAFFKDRTIRCFHIALSFWYLPLTSLALGSLSCIPTSDGRSYFMITDPSQRCYTGLSIAAVSVSVFVLVFLTIVYPIAALHHLLKPKSKEKIVADDFRFACRWDLYYDTLSKTQPYFWVTDFPILIIVALGKSALRPHVNYQMAISLAVFSVKLLAILKLRPYRDVPTNVIQGLMVCVSLIMININFFARHTKSASFRTIASAMTGVAIGTLVGQIVCCAILFVVALKATTVVVRKVRGKGEDSDGLHLDPIDLNFEAPPAGAPAQPNQVEIGVFEILSSRLGDLVNSLWDSGAAQPPVLTTAREEEEVEEAGKAGVRPALAPAT